jgi:hypothetical protein
MEQLPYALENACMPETIRFEVELPLAALRFPKSVEKRLHTLLDKQDDGTRLTVAERSEAEGLCKLVDLVSLLRLRAERKCRSGS